MSYRTYENYKDSGISWIGQIPEDWSVCRVKNKFTIKSGEPPVKKEDGIYEIIGANGCIGFTDDFNIIKKHITIGRVGAAGSVNITPSKAFVSDNALILDFNKDIVFNYVFYLFKALNLDYLINKNAQPLITATQVKNLFILNISNGEQKKIANFLDKKTAEIDESISKNKKLVSLLEEKKTVLINQVVTKGLNKDVLMKDSGIEWIGKIPEHWGCRKINTLASVRRGASPRPIDDPKYFDEDGTYSWVRISDVTSSEKYLEKTEQKLSSLGKSLSVPMEPGNIFVSIAATVGKPIINNIKCCIHDGFVYFKNLELYEGYLFYIFEGKESYKGLGKLGTQLNLNTETIGRIYVPVPPEEEQKKIEKYLEQEINKINKIINKTQENIELLEEYKTSLIHHVVTGKIDVRDEV